MTLDLVDFSTDNNAEGAEVPDSELIVNRIGLPMELPVQVAFAAPVLPSFEKTGPQWYAAFTQAGIAQTHRSHPG